MPRVIHTVEQIITKLREAEVALSRGQTVVQVCRTLGITEQAPGRIAQWRDLRDALGSHGAHRTLAAHLQPDSPAQRVGQSPAGSRGQGTSGAAMRLDSQGMWYNIRGQVRS